MMPRKLADLIFRRRRTAIADQRLADLAAMFRAHEPIQGPLRPPAEAKSADDPPPLVRQLTNSGSGYYSTGQEATGKKRRAAAREALERWKERGGAPAMLASPYGMETHVGWMLDLLDMRAHASTPLEGCPACRAGWQLAAVGNLAPASIEGWASALVEVIHSLKPGVAGMLQANVVDHLKSGFAAGTQPLGDPLAVPARRDPETGLATDADFLRAITTTLTTTNTDTVALLAVRLDDPHLLEGRLPPQARRDLFVLLLHRVQLMVDNSPCCAVGRNGADILVSFTGRDRCAAVRQVVAPLLQWLSDPLRHYGQTFALRPRIGLAYAHAGDTADELLERARIAWNDSRLAETKWKAADRARSDAFRQETALLADLSQALQRHTIQANYRRIEAADKAGLVGAQAIPVLAGHHDVHEHLGPAQGTGATTALFKEVLTIACYDAAGWHSQSRATTPFAMVDVPPQALLADQLVSTIRTALKRTGLPARLLNLGISAHSLGRDQHSAEQLAALAAIGVGLTLTGFDTHAPTSALTAAAWSVVSIPASAVAALFDGDSTPRDRVVPTALISTVHELGYQVMLDGCPLAGVRRHSVSAGLLCPGSIMTAAGIAEDRVWTTTGTVFAPTEDNDQYRSCTVPVQVCAPHHDALSWKPGR
jgi:EAL domain-containing protein (putative c-di-GMP-specific phosphodiesterase class I)